MAIKKFKKEIKEYFNTKEEGAVNQYVGCMIKMREQWSLFTSEGLKKKIEEKYEEELNNVREYGTPATPGQGTVRTKEGDECLNESEQFKYRSVVGMMLFLVKYSRLDITNAVRKLSKANNNADYTHYKQIL